MKTSKETSEIFKALVKAQAEMGNAKKNSKNPFFKSSYSDLESVINAIKEPLNNSGLAVLQSMGTRKSGTQYVETVVLHTSGQWIRSRTNVVIAKERDPQAMGSAVTYAKRYGLQALLLIPSVDDDGEAAMQRNKPLENTTKVLSMENEIKSYIERDNLNLNKMLEWVGSKSKTIKGLTVPEQAKLLKELRGRK